MTLKPNQLYVCRSLPTHWVATDGDGNPWMFPAMACGWTMRAQFLGYPIALVEVDNAKAAGTGWPPPRRCHGCGRAVDAHAGLSVVFCGRCGDTEGDSSIGEGECEKCGSYSRLWATSGALEDVYRELCRRCFDGGMP